jgi:hypothetical protein
MDAGIAGIWKIIPDEIESTRQQDTAIAVIGSEFLSRLEIPLSEKSHEGLQRGERRACRNISGEVLSDGRHQMVSIGVDQKERRRDTSQRPSEGDPPSGLPWSFRHDLSPDH